MYPEQALQVLSVPDAMLTDAEAREAVNTLGMLVAMLDQLCPCDKNAGTTDGPQQECPLHGDGVAFVTDVRQMRRVEHAARLLVGGLRGQTESVTEVDNGPFDRLRRVLAGWTG